MTSCFSDRHYWNYKILLKPLLERAPVNTFKGQPKIESSSLLSMEDTKHLCWKTIAIRPTLEIQAEKMVSRILGPSRLNQLNYLSKRRFTSSRRLFQSQEVHVQDVRQPIGAIRGGSVSSYHSSTGPYADRDWTQFHGPPSWHLSCQLRELSEV